MMALETHSSAHSRQSVPPTLEEEDDFYAKVLSLRDAVVAGTHPTLKLPSSAIAKLKASLLAHESSESASQRAAAPNGLGHSFTHGTVGNTNEAGQPAAMFPGLPGLGSSMPAANGAHTQRRNMEITSTGLDPIFLEKSDSLVRAEGQLKRQRIERDLFDSWENRKHTSVRDKEAFAEGPSNISIDVALANAQKRVKPLSGLKIAPRAASIATSFDENDYYSSQVQSEWSSDAGSGNGSDQAVGAYTANVESLDHRGGGALASGSKNRGKQHMHANGAPHADVSSTSKDRPNFYANETDAVDEADDEDEEYSPPEPATFDSFYNADSTMETRGVGADEDDDSEYEPGEVTQDSVVVTPYPNQASAQPSLQVPIFRNHLSHIAAPQPNRVSPLAVQKGPSIELELVNGRPEVVHKPQKRAAQVQSRPSSASPSGPGTGQGGKKKKNNNNKKRKREQEALNRSKKRQERQTAQSPPSPSYQDTYIKPEPVSPPPFANVPEVPSYPHRYTNQAAPIQIDLDSPRHPPQHQYVYASSPRFDHAPQMPPPSVMRVSSASGYRPAQRDTQDLRRVASMHYAQRPPSPTQRVYSPAGPYSTNGRVYAESRQGSIAPYAARDAPARYLPAGSRHEPLHLQEYREASPVMMPPPSAPPRRIVVDQYGNKYYAAEPASLSRASMAPVARQPEPDLGYERAPSRMPGAYQLPPQQSQYDPVESSMPPPPPIRRHVPQEQAVEFVDVNGQRFREYSTRPMDPIRYSHAPTSPVYQHPAQYEQMPPPSARPAPREPHYEQMPPPPMPPPRHEPTSPVYAAPPRAYSLRPEGREASQITYAPRQASVAPVQQFVRQEAAPPARAMSVMPEPDYGATVYQQRAPSYAPQPAVRYVDEYGREVAPREMRQASQFRY